MIRLKYKVIVKTKENKIETFYWKFINIDRLFKTIEQAELELIEYKIVGKIRI